MTTSAEHSETPTNDGQQQVAVVTGGASGIGLALARRLGQIGYAVFIADRNSDELAAATAELIAGGVEAVGVECDISDGGSLDQLARSVFDQRGRLDLLCANAGVSGPPSGLLWESSPADWARVYDVNVFGLVNTMRAFLPSMIAAGHGEILVTGSLTCFFSDTNASIYMSSKHAVHAIASSTQQQLAALDIPIRVHLLCPGGVTTRIMEHERAEAARVHGSPQDAAPTILRSNDSGSSLAADTVAEIALQSIGTDQFYVFTHGDSRARVMRAIDPLVSALADTEHLASSQGG